MTGFCLFAWGSVAVVTVLSGWLYLLVLRTLDLAPFPVWPIDT